MKRIERIEDEASLWVVRCERGLTAGEQDEFLQWLAADARHAAELARQRTNWTRLNLLADWRPEHAARPNRDLLAPAHVGFSSWCRNHSRWVVPSALAMAAGLAVGLFLLQPQSRPVAPTPLPIAPTSIAAIEQRTLDDGSTVELNRGTELSVHYTMGERRVRLVHGEANFKVVKQPGRPFVVEAHGVDVQAVGTSFNVRLDAAKVEVLVTEGKVQVQRVEPASVADRVQTAPAAILEQGQKTIVPLTTGALAPEVISVTPEQIDHLLAWQPKLLDFDEVPLRTVVSEFNRRNAPIRIEVADSELGEIIVNASIRSDNIEGFVRLLRGSFAINTIREGSTIVLRRARDE